MTKSEKIKAIQKVLEVKPDGYWGPITQGALDKLIYGVDENPDHYANSVLASSFADAADVAAFKACKRKGYSDSYCFKYGDNGVGYWGDDTSKGSGAAVALPPETMIETWGSVDEAHLQNVSVEANGRKITAKVKDTMPHRKNITNGAGLDLNPDACEGLNLTPPVLIRATWEAA